MTYDEVFECLNTVYDPEIPDLSIVDLGMIADVSLRNDEVHIRVTPTFIGCPATEWIRKRIEEALEPTRSWVQIDASSTWSTADITAHGRKTLQAFGIAPPPNSANVTPCPLCGSEHTRLTSPFGSALCRATYYCEHCQQPFEGFKTL